MGWMAADDDILSEWLALGRRDYGGEGIPMIVGIETVGRPAPRAAGPDLAADFRALAETLATAGADPAAVLELIAARRLRGPG